MNDRVTLIATGALGLFFFVSGLLGILENMLIRILLITGFVAIIINLLLINTKDDDQEKNLPE